MQEFRVIRSIGLIIVVYLASWFTAVLGADTILHLGFSKEDADLLVAYGVQKIYS